MITVKQQLAKIPAPVKQFSKRALLLLAAWTLLYTLLLKPYRIPDRLLSNITAECTAGTLSLWYSAASWQEIEHGASVIIGHEPVINIGDACNALDLFVLYAGFLFCIPTSTKRFLLFTTLGLPGIFIMNILRCNALAWLALNRMEWLDFAHKYVFTAIVYCCIFYAWVLYTKKYRPHEA